MSGTTAQGSGSTAGRLEKIIAKFGMCTPMPVPKPADADRTRAGIDTSLVWQPNETIGVWFNNGDPVYHEKVKQYAPLWTDICSLKFDFDSPGRGQDIRINFEVGGVAGGFVGRFDSYLGISSRDFNPSMNLIFDTGTINALSGNPAALESYYRRYVLHEFGHALGLIHEHQSPARSFKWNLQELYPFYLRTYGWQQAQVDSQVLAPYQGPVSNTDFDPRSVMLYPIPPGVTDPPITTDWNDNLSTLDKFLINLFYPVNETELFMDKPANGSIDKPGGAATFKFTTTAEKGKYVIETTGDSPIQMYLFGPNSRGAFVTEDHGSGEGLNARIEQDLVFAEYYVQVRNQITTDTGPFGISVKKV